MEAICKVDFDKRENARMDAEQEVESLKKERKPIDGVVNRNKDLLGLVSWLI